MSFDLSEFAKITLREEQEFTRLDSKMRKKVNADLVKAGFDGNGRFFRPDKSTVKMSEILSKYGMSIETIITPYTMWGDKGSKNLDIVFDHPTDPFRNIQITNSTLYVTWQMLGDDKYEVLAYLS